MPYNNQNQQEKYPVQTSSLIFFGDNVMMKMMFSDNLCIISFRDAKIDENGKKTYPRPSGGDKDLSAVLTRDRATTFMNRIHNEFIPKMNEFVQTRLIDPTFNKAFNIGIPTNKDMTNILAISTGKPESGPYVPELWFVAGIDMNTRMAQTIKSITFKDYTPVIYDYDPSTGEYGSITPDYPQVLLFMLALEEFVRGQCKGRIHEIDERYNERFYQLRGTINQIALKNGIQVQTNSYQQKSLPQSTTAPQPLELKTYDGDLSSFMTATGGMMDASPF